MDNMYGILSVIIIIIYTFYYNDTVAKFFALFDLSCPIFSYNYRPRFTSISLDRSIDGEDEA